MESAARAPTRDAPTALDGGGIVALSQGERGGSRFRGNDGVCLPMVPPLAEGRAQRAAPQQFGSYLPQSGGVEASGLAW